MMMKRILAILLTLSLTLGMLPAMAEEEDETGAATNPYTSEGLSATIALPDNVNVTNEEVQEGSVVMTLAMDGRSDVGFTISVVYNEAYADYTMIDLPDDLRQQMIDYYTQNYPGNAAPFFQDASDMEEFGQYFAPFFASGKGSDGNLYVIYLCVCKGFVLTASAGIASDDFDYDAAGVIFNLYWQGVDMFYQFLVNMGVFEE